jgi:pyridoxal phosphate enzyme (YggS family)
MIKKNLEVVRNNIERTAIRSGRDPSSIRLIVVSKSQSPGLITEAINAGVKNFGENYPEETLKKILVLEKNQIDIHWHMIGHLQSRKTQIICDHFHYIHSIDSIHIADKLDKLLEKSNKNLDGLIELNVSGESTKYGFPAWDSESLDNLIPNLELISKFKRFRIKGLMTMPPLFDDPEKCRPYFKRLLDVQIQIKNALPDLDLKELSMGTSIDYSVAIEEGATILRIGQAIFGPRISQK